MNRFARSLYAILAAANGVTPMGLMALALVIALVVVWILAFVVIRIM